MMKKLYSLLLAAVMVVGLASATMAMDFSTYVGGDFIYSFTSAWGAPPNLNDGINDFYWPTCGSGLWLELDMTAKIADNVTVGAAIGYWYESDGTGGQYDAWEDWCGLDAYIKIKDVFDLFNVTVSSDTGKIKLGPAMMNENWFNKGHVSVQLDAALLEGLSVSANIATPDPGAYGYIVGGSFTTDLFTITAAYGDSPAHTNHVGDHWILDPVTGLIIWQPNDTETAKTAFAFGATINAIEGLKIGAMYGDRDGATAYLVEGTFTGVEGLSITAKYGHKDGGYGAYVDPKWGPPAVYYKDMAGWFEVTSAQIDMIYVGASYKVMDGLTIGGSYAQDSAGGATEYLVRGDFAVSEGLQIYGVYRSFQLCPIYEVGANVAVGGGLNLKVFYLDDSWWGGVYYGAILSVSLW